MSFLLCSDTGRDRLSRAAAGLSNSPNVQRSSNDTTGGDGDTDTSRQLWADTDSTGEQWTRSHRWLCHFPPSDRVNAHFMLTFTSCVSPSWWSVHEKNLWNINKLSLSIEILIIQFSFDNNILGMFNLYHIIIFDKPPYCVCKEVQKYRAFTSWRLDFHGNKTVNDASLKKNNRKSRFIKTINWTVTTNVDITHTCSTLIRLSQFLLQRAHEDHRKLRRPPCVRRRQQARRGRLRHRIQRSPERQACCGEKTHSSKCQILTSQSRAVGDLVNHNLSYYLPLRWMTSPRTSCEFSSTKRSKLWKCMFHLLSLSSLIPRLLLGFRLTATS